jgi:hypothetical protein
MNTKLSSELASCQEIDRRNATGAYGLSCDVLVVISCQRVPSFLKGVIA